MKAMYRWIVCAGIILAAGFAASSLLSRDNAAAQAQAAPAQKGTPAASQEALVARGQYLVDNVGMCSECHTSRDANNNLDNSKYLQGAPTWIMPVHNMTNWAWRAPAIAGLEGFTDSSGGNSPRKGRGPQRHRHPPAHAHLSYESLGRAGGRRLSALAAQQLHPAINSARIAKLRPPQSVQGRRHR